MDAATTVTASGGEQAVFWVLAAMTVFFAGFTITRRNPVTAVMSLVGTFFCLAGIYATLSAHFLAILQVLVYAGAIMVLFIFVVMILNREEVSPISCDRGRRHRLALASEGGRGGSCRGRPQGVRAARDARLPGAAGRGASG
jgi:uncharacterized MnhB-related membrane protein